LIAVHDLNLAARFCDEILLLNLGEKVTEGVPKQVFTRENIEKVYGISVEIIDYKGIPTILTT
jgi:iron complex transport system ATP-binding protein